MIKTEDVYKIGKLNRAHGLKGEINFLFTDDTWDRAEADHLICEVDGIMVPFAGDEVSGCALCAMATHAEDGSSLSGGADVEGFSTLIIKCIDAVAGT